MLFCLECWRAIKNPASGGAKLFRQWRRFLAEWYTFSGSNLSNPPFWSVNRHFQTKCTKYSNFCVIKTTAAILTTVCRVIKTSICSSWVVLKCAPKSKMAGSRHLETSDKTPYLSNCLTAFDDLYATWHVSTLRSASWMVTLILLPI